jgi:hypothetical protein
LTAELDNRAWTSTVTDSAEGTVISYVGGYSPMVLTGIMANQLT